MYIAKSRVIEHRAILNLVQRLWFPLTLAGVILGFYWASLSFPLIWDDPQWYQQGAGRSLWDLLGPTPSYQFYRPLALFWSNCFLVDGTVDVQAAHIVQLLVHLGNTLLVLKLALSLGLNHRTSRLAALVFALHPFSYQAVSWQAAHQPFSLLLILLAVDLALIYGRDKKWWILTASAFTYACALLFHESAAAFVWVFWGIALAPALKNGQRRSWGWLKKNLWPLVFVALVGIYVWIWWNIPRLDAYTVFSPETISLVYLLQSVVAPLAALVQLCGLNLSTIALFIVLLIGITGLFVWVGKSKGWFISSVALLWVLVGLAPVWVGLDWGYIQLGPRLVYQSLPGTALLWSLAIDALCVHRRLAVRLLGIATTVFVFGVAIWQLYQQDGLSRVALRLQNDLLATMPDNGEKYLFVNYPDRLSLEKPPFPLGYWGVIISPAAAQIDVSDFAYMTSGVQVETTNVSVPALELDEREEFDFKIDLRGVPVGSAEFSKLALSADHVYVTRYQDGRIFLQDETKDSALYNKTEAIFGDFLLLRNYSLEVVNHRLSINLVWEALDHGVVGDTIFVHLLSPEGVYLAGADGDLMLGILPLFECPIGELITDKRSIDVGDLVGQECVVTVGIYNRDSGIRATVQTSDLGITNNEAILGSVFIP